MRTYTIVGTEFSHYQTMHFLKSNLPMLAEDTNVLIYWIREQFFGESYAWDDSKLSD